MSEHDVAMGAPRVELVDDDAPAPPRRRRRSIADFLGPAVVFLIFLGVWEYIHRDGLRRFWNKPGFLVPSPATVIDKSFIKDPEIRSALFTGVGWTLVVALIGLALSIVIGTILAVAMVQARWVENSVYPYLVALQAIPVLAIAPQISSVFGPEMTSRVFVCVMISIFPIVSNTLFGLRAAEPSQHDLFTLRHSGRLRRLLKLQFPAALPAIFTGYRISAGLSVIGAVVGEQFFRQGSKPGIGIVMEQFRIKGAFPQSFGGLILACLLGIAVFLAFGFIRRVAIGKWYDEDASQAS